MIPSRIADYLAVLNQITPADPVTINEQGQPPWPNVTNQSDGSSSDLVTQTPDTRPQFRTHRRMPDQTQQTSLSRAEGGRMDWHADIEESDESPEPSQVMQANPRPLANISKVEAYLMAVMSRIKL